MQDAAQPTGTNADILYTNIISFTEFLQQKDGRFFYRLSFLLSVTIFIYLLK
jgi:hypothetical protein